MCKYCIFAVIKDTDYYVYCTLKEQECKSCYICRYCSTPSPYSIKDEYTGGEKCERQNIYNR